MLSSAQISRYRDDGYILVPGLIGKEEARTYRTASHSLIDRLSANADLNATWGSARSAVAERNPVVLHCHNVQFYDGIFSKLLVDDRFTACAAALIDSENVELHHTKLFVKPPEVGAPFPMHQDYPYFPHAKHSMTAAVFHFDDAPVEKGCLRVVPGSHLVGPLPHDAAGGYHLPLSDYAVESAMPVPAYAGDVLFFNYLTIHGSGQNTSDEARTTLLVQVRNPEDLPTEDTHRSRGQGMMLRGYNPVTSYGGLE